MVLLFFFSVIEKGMNWYLNANCHEFFRSLFVPKQIQRPVNWNKLIYRSATILQLYLAPDLVRTTEVSYPERQRKGVPHS